MACRSTKQGTVIAASVLRIGVSVMTSDAHFSRIDGLRVIAPPPEWFG